MEVLNQVGWPDKELIYTSSTYSWAYFALLPYKWWNLLNLRHISLVFSLGREHYSVDRK